MADVIISTNMNLPVPVVGVDPGPTYASDLNSCLTLIDAHNHSAGSGVPITPDGLNINSDLPLNNSNLTLVRSVRFTVQGTPLALVTDIGCAYVSGADLYYNDTLGNQVRITQSGAVAGTPGSIANLVSPASATYVSATPAFVFQSAANTPANLDGGAVVLRNILANSKGLTLSPPSAMGSNYSLTLPSLPAATKFVSLDSSGNFGATWAVDGSTLEISSNTLQVKSGGITATQMGTSLPTIQKFTSGSGTYTSPASVRYIRVRGVAGGGGGSGSGSNSGGGGVAGGNTTFGAVISAIGGTGGVFQGAPGPGGAVTVNSPAIGSSWTGGGGGGPGNSASSGGVSGGAGGNSIFGGGGVAGAAGAGAGGAGAANSGGGGAGGGGTTGINAGSSGGAGGGFDVLIIAPSATYSYAVGAAGTAGTAGVSGAVGGAGGSGYIEVTEFYL